MSVLRDQTIRPKVRYRILTPIGTGTIIGVTDRVVDGEVIPRCRVVVYPSASKSSPVVTEFDVTDPTAVDGPSQPVLLARRILGWLSARRGPITSEDLAAWNAALILLGVRPPEVPGA